METPRINKLWENYQKMAIPADASAEQVKGSRLAFYGGFLSMLMLLEVIGGDKVSEDQGFIILNALTSEAERFIRTDIMSKLG